MNDNELQAEIQAALVRERLAKRVKPEASLFDEPTESSDIHGDAVVTAFPNPARFDGDDYESDRDDARLTGQLLRIYNLMSDHQWRTVSQIAKTTGDPSPSILAQLGHLRKERFGAYLVERRRVNDSGLYEWRVMGKGEGTPKHRPCGNCSQLEARIARAIEALNNRTEGPYDRCELALVILKGEV